ncbi:hypothetical protein ACJQWK_10654 [Exserohilum turcicum]|uniref:Uncharacterized protein n=1 Tax=Exserohilum turcicum (strain 28A) TaxID=671987 RepID=R0JV96_EXST2|nr:uncharacterized protein SETTUDRAFT_35262 [Exserohilum turcica Et28A]EOA81424.1 hypothetical protein SETTUDRAFT_35262 [Exserohilum turcica Et28A]
MTRVPAAIDKSHATTPQTPPPVLAISPARNAPLPFARSPRTPVNQHWIHVHQRRIFIRHLKQWSMSHDSSPHFQGKISLLPPDPKRSEELVLGKSVQCVLTDSSFKDCRKKVVVRLFSPQMGRKSKSRKQSAKTTVTMDPMDAYDHTDTYTDLDEATYAFTEDDAAQPASQARANPPSGYYKLVIRCGSGWLSAREYFNKLYFTRLAVKNIGPDSNPVFKNADDTFTTRSQALGPRPASEDTVDIQPLFHPFLRLPQELQEMILMTAAGLTRHYDLLPDLSYRLRAKRVQSPISLSTLLRISPAITDTLQPYILHRTVFHFGLTGTTNFLWQSGPVNRSHIRRLAFHFGRGALLHSVRWLAPDQIFDLLQPPVQKDMGGLPYFWRCQLRALTNEVHLSELIIDVQAIPHTDLAMVVRIMKEAFGGLEKVTFVETCLDGKTKVLGSGDTRLKDVGNASWRDMTKGYVERYKRQVGWHNYHFGLEVAGMTEEELEKSMDVEKKFFDS